MTTVFTQPLTVDDFAPYGQVIECGGEATTINQGNCQRFHDLVDAEYDGDLMERHPLGSQAFIPMSEDGFLILVADDENGHPVNIKAFVSQPNQGINLRKNTWHGVLTPLSGSGIFAVFDRIGDGNNLEEHPLKQPILVKNP